MPMTLEEAIEHLNEILADENGWPCEACKSEHVQLREWLIELKQRRGEIKSAPVVETTYRPFLDLRGSQTDIMIMSVPLSVEGIKDIDKESVYADYRCFLTRNKRLSLGIMNPVEAIGAVMRYVQVRIPKNEGRNYIVITCTEAVLIKNQVYTVNIRTHNTIIKCTCVNLKTGEEAEINIVVDCFDISNIFERKDLIIHESEWCTDLETLNKVEGLRITFDILIGNSNIKGVLCTTEPERIGMQTDVTSERIERFTLGMIYHVADKLDIEGDIYINFATMGVRRNTHSKYNTYSSEASWDNVVCKNAPEFNRTATININDNYSYEVEALRFKKRIEDYVDDNLVTIVATQYEPEPELDPKDIKVGTEVTMNLYLADDFIGGEDHDS